MHSSETKIEAIGFYNKRQVMEITSLSAATIWRLVRDGMFPKPINLSSGRVGWERAAVNRWVIDRLAG